MFENRHDIFTKCQDDLELSGFSTVPFAPAEELKKLVLSKDYDALDAQIKVLTMPEGELFKLLSQFETFNSIEFIISLREAKNDWEEDGIWHDDGSRVLAFSLSLTLDTPDGGKLSFRRKGAMDAMDIPTPTYGDMIIFKTGFSGYEHKINAVTKGSRLVCAGWCS
jgi:hypothetical protein